jgi:GH25 family lysozyme M1 (1,4-beta-N-acetylmuramidase)
LKIKYTLLIDFLKEKYYFWEEKGAVMTRIILESANNKDVLLITELAESLRIKYKIEQVSSNQNKYELKKDLDNLIREGVDISNYGEPSEWQRNVRKDRTNNSAQL